MQIWGVESVILRGLFQLMRCRTTYIYRIAEALETMDTGNIVEM